ncbi:hypothetical protein Hanom_Chr12g01135091 [Helianthus anomalus]
MSRRDRDDGSESNVSSNIISVTGRHQKRNLARQQTNTCKHNPTNTHLPHRCFPLFLSLFFKYREDRLTKAHNHMTLPNLVDQVSYD